MNTRKFLEETTFTHDSQNKLPGAEKRSPRKKSYIFTSKKILKISIYDVVGHDDILTSLICNLFLSGIQNRK